MRAFLKTTILLASLVMSGYVALPVSAAEVAPPKVGGILPPLAVVTDVFAHATKPGQPVGAVYMTIKPLTDTKLVKAESDVSNITEIHSMGMENGVMKMKAISALPLPAGQIVKLKPGGYHIMLIELKKPLVTGETVNLKLSFEGKEKVSVIPVQAVVREIKASHMHQHQHEHAAH